MNKRALFLILIVSLLGVFGCKEDDDEDRGAMKRNLIGNWRETYHFSVTLPGGKTDSIHTTLLTFTETSFTAVQYRDSLLNRYDTTFTGTFEAYSDTLFLTPGDWTEVYYATFLSDTSVMIAPMYSIDAGGYTVGDFEPVLWVTNAKKRGVFVRR